MHDNQTGPPCLGSMHRHQHIVLCRPFSWGQEFQGLRFPTTDRPERLAACRGSTQEKEILLPKQSIWLVCVGAYKINMNTPYKPSHDYHPPWFLLEVASSSHPQMPGIYTVTLPPEMAPFHLHIRCSTRVCKGEFHWSFSNFLRMFSDMLFRTK